MINEILSERLNKYGFPDLGRPLTISDIENELNGYFDRIEEVKTPYGKQIRAYAKDGFSVSGISPEQAIVNLYTLNKENERHKESIERLRRKSYVR